MNKTIYLFSVFLLLISSWSLHATGVLAPTGLRVLSYNVWGMPFPIRPTHKKLRQAPHIIPKLGADIIHMQEVFIKRARDFGQMTEYPYVAWGAGPKGIKVLGSGLLIASKYPLSDVDTISYSACSGSDCLARKGALYAKVTIPGFGEIDLINTHLNAGTNRKTKEKQLKQLEDFVASKRSHRPLLIMGDFNLEPKSIFYRTFAYLFDVEDSHSTYLEKNPDSSQKVRDGYTYVMDVGPVHIRQKLDYIWYRSGVDHSLELQNYSVIFDGSNGWPKLSDHYGLTSDFQLY